jgi:hypothetical protein
MGIHWHSFCIFALSLCSICAQAATSGNHTPPNFSYNQRTIAEAALADTFTFQGVQGSPIAANRTGYDWDHRGPKNDQEWAWFLNRHRYFQTLYLAYQATGDTRYLQKIYSILEDWLQGHSHPPKHMSFSSAWRPLEAARRILDSWDLVYLKLWNDPLFPESLRTRFKTSLIAHGDYLQAHHALYGNHQITEMIALLKLAVLCPEAPNSDTWMRYALGKLGEAYDQQVYPDGAHKELSAHYQRVVARNYQKLLDLLQTTQHHDLIHEWRPRVDALWSYLSGISKPNGTAPLNNDSDRESVQHLLNAIGHSSWTPPRQSQYYPNAGQVVFRNDSAGPDSAWAFFDIGPRGTDHQHDDHLHLSLSYGELDVLVDHGRYTYKPGPWREYFQGPRGHNTLMVDGLASTQMPNQAARPLNGSGYQSTDAFEIAWGSTTFDSTTGARIADWQRAVLHLPQNTVLVLDHLITFRPRMIEGHWHGAPKTVWKLQQHSVQMSRAERYATLSFANSRARPMRTELNIGAVTPRITGWHSERFNVKAPSATLYYSTMIDRPTTFAWFFTQSSQPIQIETLTQIGQNIELSYRHGTTRYRLYGPLPIETQTIRLDLETDPFTDSD